MFSFCLLPIKPLQPEHGVRCCSNGYTSTCSMLTFLSSLTEAFHPSCTSSIRQHFSPASFLQCSEALTCILSSCNLDSYEPPLFISIKTAQQCTTRLQLSPLGSLIYNSVAITYRMSQYLYNKDCTTMYYKITIVTTRISDLQQCCHYLSNVLVKGLSIRVSYF